MTASLKAQLKVSVPEPKGAMECSNVSASHRTLTILYLQLGMNSLLSFPL